MKKNIFLLATASILVAASCGKDGNGGNGGASAGCYTCTITTSAPNVAPQTTTSSFCNATEEYVRNFEGTTTSGNVTQTITCVKQ